MYLKKWPLNLGVSGHMTGSGPELLLTVYLLVTSWRGVARNLEEY